MNLEDLRSFVMSAFCLTVAVNNLCEMIALAKGLCIA